ncbi:hypothetical protein FD755_007653, partial [Muntiacus reevesi]
GSPRTGSLSLISTYYYKFRYIFILPLRRQVASPSPFSCPFCIHSPHCSHKILSCWCPVRATSLLRGVQLFATPVDCSRSGSSIHRILQARILEWDVLGGILITAVLIVLTYPAWTLIDRLDSASPLLPVCVLVVPFLLCYNYPVSDYYSPTRADTTTILAAGAGVTIGFWINHFFQLVSEPTESLPVVQNIPPLTTELLAVGLAKFTVGIVLILLVRQLVQKLSLQVLYSWFKVVTRNKEARRRLEIEVPYKFVTYTSVGICATTFVPMLHRFLGLL